jgi:hypothetical protein
LLEPEFFGLDEVLFANSSDMDAEPGPDLSGDRPSARFRAVGKVRAADGGMNRSVNHGDTRPGESGVGHGSGRAS